MQPSTADTSSSPPLHRIARYQAAFESSFAALLALLLVWKDLLPAWKTLNTDFPNYYVAARLIREHYTLDRIYDWIWFQRAANHFGIEHQLVGFLGLTPFSALPIFPISWLPALEAKRVWIVLNLLLLVAAVQWLGKVTGLDVRKRWIVALLAVIPLRTNFLYGQMHLLVFALLVTAYVSHIRGKQAASGIWIALAAALKIYPIFFCLYFLLKRRWKALGAALLCMAACVAVAYLVAGKTATNLYFLQQFPRLLQGESEEPFLSGVASSSALFHRLFLFEPELNPHPLLQSPLLFSILLSLWQALLAGITLSRLRFSFNTDDRETLEWASMLSLLLVLSSAPATYHFVVLIAAAIPTVAVLLRLQRYKSVCVFLLLYVGTCNLRTFDTGSHVLDILTPLRYVKLLAGVALVAFYCFLLSSFKESTAPRRAWWLSQRLRIAVAFTSVLWVMGFLSAWRHQKDLCQDCARRITPADDAYFRTSPQQTADGLTYTAMLPDGYRVVRDRTPLFDRPGPPWPPDQLTFSASRTTDDLWLELAGTRSRIGPIPAAASASPPCAVDGENPALSSDGLSVAFLRENHGHGSLWLMNRSDCGHTSGSVPATRLTPSVFDVRTLSAGPSGNLFFSAVYQGRERIFELPPQSLPDASLKLLSNDDSDLDAPSPSPSGAVIAARKLIAGRWQLITLDVASGREKQLTFADCNAYTPSWKDANTLLYATDCERGLGLTALAWLHVSQ